jgi:hypothetical protein
LIHTYPKVKPPALLKGLYRLEHMRYPSPSAGLVWEHAALPPLGKEEWVMSRWAIWTWCLYVTMTCNWWWLQNCRYQGGGAGTGLDGRVVYRASLRSTSSRVCLPKDREVECRWKQLYTANTLRNSWASKTTTKKVLSLSPHMAT